MKLYIVRHGEKQSQVTETGEFDIGLSETGKEQATRVGKFFKSKKIDFIYCSELERAKQTLAHMQEFLNSSKIIYTKELNELSKGIYKSREEFKEAVKKSGLKEHQFRPQSGENYFDVEARAEKFFKYLLQKYKEDETIVLVGHGIFFRLMILRMLNLHMQEMAYFDLPTASISYIDWKGGKVNDLKISYNEHLINF